MMSMERYQSVFFSLFQFFFFLAKEKHLGSLLKVGFLGGFEYRFFVFSGERERGENIFGFDFGENETKFGIFIMDRVKGSRDIHQFSSGFVYKSTRYIYV